MFMNYLDRAFCASPNCKNDCGRKMTEYERANLKYWHGQVVSYAYFCGEENELVKNGLFCGSSEVEQRPVKPLVEGSTPSCRAKTQSA
jgi:hypothetical protein